MRARDYHEAIDREVAMWPGASVSFTHAARHQVAVVEFQGKSRKVFFPTSPSDGMRGRLNCLRDVRGELQYLGAERVEVQRAANDHAKPHKKPVTPFGSVRVEIIDRDPWAPLAALKARMEGK